MSTSSTVKMISEQSFKAFKKIADFVSQLHESFCTDSSSSEGGKFHELTLYNHLLGKTKLSNKTAIARHIEIFKEFCDRNQQALTTRDYKKIVSHRISYSSKTFIDVYAILSQSDLSQDDANSIWNHLLVIQACVDPSSQAKELLKQFKESRNSGTAEGKFLNDFLGNLESKVDKTNTNPMQAAASLLQGGVLQDLVGSLQTGVNNGSLNIGKLVGTVQSLLGGIAGEAEGSSGGFDIGGLMGMFGSMMGGAGGGGLSGLNPEKIVKDIEAKVEEEKKSNLGYNAVVSENPSVPETKTNTTDGPD